MRLLKKLFGKKDQPPSEDARSGQVAFVLLAEARLPNADAIVRSFSTFAPPGERIREQVTEGENSTDGQVLSFQFDSKGTVFVALMPVPVPKGEADAGAQFSVSSFGTDWKLGPHTAHLIVAMLPSDSVSAIDSLSRFTSLLAAVAQSSDSVGIYWGNAGATHDSEFFISIAGDLGVVPRIMLWSGMSIGREEDGRLSLLSLGMQQLNLPELLLVVPESSKDDALETFFDLLAYAAERGEALPEGDTVGRTANERLPIRYVKSPVDSKEMVWRVELP